jgi:hypothetical protein
MQFLMGNFTSIFSKISGSKPRSYRGFSENRVFAICGPGSSPTPGFFDRYGISRKFCLYGGRILPIPDFPDKKIEFGKYLGGPARIFGPKMGEKVGDHKMP